MPRHLRGQHGLAGLGVRRHGLRAGARLIAELLLLGLLGLPLVGLLLVFSVWIVGVSAIATALPIATAAVVATPLWGVARLCGMAAASDGAREPG